MEKLDKSMPYRLILLKIYLSSPRKDTKFNKKQSDPENSPWNV